MTVSVVGRRSAQNCSFDECVECESDHKSGASSFQRVGQPNLPQNSWARNSCISKKLAMDRVPNCQQGNTDRSQ